MTDPVMTYSNLMRLQIDRLSPIAENASNVNSAGYLHESNQIDQNQFLSLLRGQNYASGFVSSRSAELGTLKITNIASDLALLSDHWFIVTLGEKEAFTRNGNFTITKEGELKLGQYAVLGESGPIKNISEIPRVDAEGSVYVGETLIDRIKVVSLNLDSDVVSLGNGIYESTGVGSIAQNPQVVQGALNSSNVNLEADMTRLIEITRHIESMQRAISAYDRMLDVGINQLGK